MNGPDLIDTPSLEQSLKDGSLPAKFAGFVSYSTTINQFRLENGRNRTVSEWLYEFVQSIEKTKLCDGHRNRKPLKHGKAVLIVKPQNQVFDLRKRTINRNGYAEPLEGPKTNNSSLTGGSILNAVFKGVLKWF